MTEDSSIRETIRSEVSSRHINFQLEQQYKELTALKASGKYVPPAKVRDILDKLQLENSSEENQKLEWEKLRKNINGLVNKLTSGNIKMVVLDMFNLNLVRGMGLLLRSIMKAQSQALSFTPIYASLVSVLNSKIPEIGKLLCSRLILQFRKSFRKDDKTLCIASTLFLAHLCNHQVIHELLTFEIAHLLLINPTDDSVNILISLLKHAGSFLTEQNPNAVLQIFEKLRHILQEGKLEKRTQFLVEKLFLIRKAEYSEFPPIIDELDLVDDEDIVTHELRLNDKLTAEDSLNFFSFDDKYEENEKLYGKIRLDVLGDDHEVEAEEEQVADREQGERLLSLQDTGMENKREDDRPAQLIIKDMTDTNLINFKKKIYLVLKGSMSADEAVHKLLKSGIRKEDEAKVVDMIVKSCSQETTYSKYYGVTGEKLCSQSRSWSNAFKECFVGGYETVHRCESNALRNISKFWGHMLSSDALDWECLDVIKLTEEDTTPSGRIFIKFVFQELVEELGVYRLKEKLEEDFVQPFINGIFPKENPDKIRFSINYFTAIGLGILTEEMRLNLQEIVEKQKEEQKNRGRSKSRHSSRSSSYSGSSYSRSYSRSNSESRSRGESCERSDSGHRGITNVRDVHTRSPLRDYSHERSASRTRDGMVGEERPPSTSPQRSLKRVRLGHQSRTPSRSPTTSRQNSLSDRYGTSEPRSQAKYYRGKEIEGAKGLEAGMSRGNRMGGRGRGRGYRGRHADY